MTGTNVSPFKGSTFKVQRPASSVRRLAFMNNRPFVFAILLSVPLALPAQAPEPRTNQQFTVNGTVRDGVTGEPIPFVVANVVGTRQSAMTDRDGGYRLPVPAGRSQLRFRKIGYRMAIHEVDSLRADLTLDVALDPVPVELDTIAVVAERDDLATRIIREAIARKNDVLARIHDYRYKGYVKFLVRDLKKHADSTESVFLITETQTTAYWQQPDDYQEVITARRQSSNLEAENNLVSVGQIVNFNKDRIDLVKYAVVSPTADDALDHYDYHIADTLFIDGRLVYRLAIEPESDANPLFVGWIDIADDTYDVVAVDVGTNDAVRFDFFDNLRYRQRLSDVGDDIWLPSEIRFTGELHLGVPIPGFPEHLSFTHEAQLSEFVFDAGDPPPGIGEYVVVVDDDADDVDSTAWDAKRPNPLSQLEQAAYQRLDSLENRPKSVGRYVLTGLGGAALLTFNHDFFHYNRVEAAYLGIGTTIRDVSPRLNVRVKAGYAFGAERWQHRYGAEYRVLNRQRVWVGARYQDEIVARPSLISASRNATHPALFFKIDPLDYYRSKGVTLSARTKLVDFTQLAVRYNAVRHASLDVNDDFSFFNRDHPLRANPPVSDGRLRSIAASVTLDTRPRLNSKGRDYYFNTITRTQATVAVEYASPSLIDNDFDFVRYWLRFHRRQRTLRFGITTLDIHAGISTGDLPPQRYFTVDFGNGVLYQENGFNTLAETNFTGNRALMIFATHDFDQQLFRKSRIPLIRDVPFTLSVHGGAFWTDFVDHTPQPGDGAYGRAPTAYTELGFGIGNLTPMITPLNFAVWFTWQLSGYETERFVFRLGLLAG